MSANGDLSNDNHTDIMEEFQKIDVVLLLPEMLLQQEVDGTLEQERVVDCNVPHTGL